MTTTRTQRAHTPRATLGRPGQASARDVELKRMLTARRDEILGRVKHGIDEARADLVGHDDAVLDEGETSSVNIQQDVAFAIIQMNAETLRLLDAALLRLDHGAYGQCVECRQAIAEQRLRALPFVVRCRDCEDAYEKAAHEPGHRFASLR
jgi:RNA polymerase-binding transcription factor DksA